MTVGVSFERGAPEAQGIPTSAVLAFVDAAERGVHDLHSFILLRRGVVVAEGYWEPYRAEQRHMLFSLSKSFTSTAIGLLVAEGRLTVDDPVLGFFPDEAPAEPGELLRRMRVRDLLTMTTGHDVDPTRTVRDRGPSWVRTFLADPPTHEPGTHFVYNSVATYMLSAIAQRLSGQRLLEYLTPRLFEPLGIEGATWEQSPEGIDVGGWGLSIRTADIARFGQLLQQKGSWNGRQLVPAAWVEEATARQVPNGPSANPDWVQGYGYQFWRCRHGAYRGDGAFGQFCVVMPEQEAVLAVTAGVANMQAALDLLWEHLLPAFGPGALPADPAGQRALEDRLGALRLAPAAGQPTSRLAAELSGREFAVEANAEGVETLRFDFAEDGGTLTMRNPLGALAIPCGRGRWLRTEGTPYGPVAASAAWVDERTWVVELVWYETPFRRRLTCRFDGERVAVEQAVNVAFGPTERPTLEGRAVAAVPGG
jgi:CubicO group peptidase (beta-lactamase class C family)